MWKADAATVSIGHNYAGRLDNKDVLILILLMRKLPDESMKRRLVDKAGVSSSAIDSLGQYPGEKGIKQNEGFTSQVYYPC